MISLNSQEVSKLSKKERTNFSNRFGTIKLTKEKEESNNDEPITIKVSIKPSSNHLARFQPKKDEPIFKDHYWHYETIPLPTCPKCDGILLMKYQVKEITCEKCQIRFTHYKSG